MARPIKMQEETLLRVMQKSLKPLEVSMSQISRSFISQTVENKLENKRAEKITQDNEIKQTGLLGAISSALTDRKEKQKASGPMGGLGKGLFTFLKNHWGKILGGLGIAGALTMDAKDIMSAINSLETIMTKEFWEKYGGWIAGGLLGALAAASFAPVGIAIGSAIITYMLGKKLLENFGKKLLAQTAVQKGLNTIPNVGNKNVKEHTQAIKDNKKFATEKLSKASKTSRLMPILGMAGKILGWTYVAYTAGSAIKQNFFDDKSAGKDFGDKIKGTLASFVSKFTNGLIKEETVTGLIDNTTQGIKDGATALTLGIMKAYKSTEKWVKKTTADIITKAQKVVEGIKKTPQLLKKGRQEALGPTGGGGLPSPSVNQKDKAAAAKARRGEGVSGSPDAMERFKMQQGLGGDTGEPSILDKIWTHGFSGTKSKTMPSSWNKRSKDIVSGLDPSFGSKIKEFVSQMWNDKGIDAVIYSGGRGQAEQTAAFEKGAGAPYPHSLHNYGGAIDFFMQSGPGVNGIWNKKNPWGLAGSVAKGLGMRWGGDFENFFDAGHLQVAKDWKQAAKTMPKLASGGIIKGGQGGVLAWIGEGNQDEMVMPLPSISPHQKMNAMNSLQNERASTQNGSTPLTINNVTNSNTNSGSSTVVMNQLVRSKQYAT